MLSGVHTLLVDRSVREQAEKLRDSTVTTDVIDPCSYVFPDGIPAVRTRSGHVVTMGTSLLSDVDFDSLLGILDGTSTTGGSACLRAVLASPIADTNILRGRQGVLTSLSTILSDPSRLYTIRRSLETLQRTEHDMSWALRHPHQDLELRSLYDMAFFKMWPLHRLNDLPIAVTALNLHRIIISPIIGVLSPLVYFVIPYLVLRFRVGLKVSISHYLRLMIASMSVASSVYSPSVQYASLGFSLIFYFQGVFSSIELATTLASVCSSICTRSDNIRAFKSSVSDLGQACASMGHTVSEYFFPETSDLASYRESGHPPSTVITPMLLRNFGRQLTSFKHTCNDLNSCCRLMKDAYALDALVSVISSKRAVAACDVTFVAGVTPVFDAKDIRHPCIPSDRSVPNSVALHVGAESAAAALLTGPNAGGKSTLMKSMLLACIMAQTVTIACCSSFRVTPYSHIHSHINVPDVQGSKSLFEAEMDRARESMDHLSSMSTQHPDRFSLIIMDEVFSSTNPIEGIAGAYSVAKKLASSKNDTLVVSTHFLYLRRLALLKSSEGHPLFQLLQMPVIISDQQRISYPYRVSSGVCEQLIALELLRASGFEEDVMLDALEIKRILLCPPSPAALKEVRGVKLTGKGQKVRCKSGR